MKFDDQIPTDAFKPVPIPAIKLPDITKPSSAPSLTFGTDPEFMVWDMEQSKMVSAIDVLKNDKYTPHDLGDGIMTYADNVMMEFSVPPCETIDQFVATIRSMLHKGHKFLGNRYRLVARASHEYDKDALKNPKAMEGGCSPNVDAYTGTPNKSPKFTDGFRTGSFHLHIGSPELDTKESKERMIKCLDVVLGLSSVVFDKDPSSLARRRLYGKAGEFRPTPYGIEYRVLGPYALKSPDTVRMVMSLVLEALKVHRHSQGKERMKLAVSQTSTQEIINLGRADTAQSLIAGFLPTPLFRNVVEARVPDLYKDWEILEPKPKEPKTEIDWNGVVKRMKTYTIKTGNF